MIIGVTKETAIHENRVALTPQTALKYNQLGFEVIMEQHAGLRACFNDSAYNEAKAEIVPEAKDVLKRCDIWLKVRAPKFAEIKQLKDYSFVVGDLQHHDLSEHFDYLSKHHIVGYALNQLERTSRAQPFDVLSSQNNLNGYRAVIKAVSLYHSAVPLMITSAGTIAPAKFLVIGLGVAGLQAIATAKRLGAKVYAYDIKPELKEQAESLGAKFVADISEVLPEINIVIASAFAPDKTAPLIIDEDKLAKIKEHAVLLDLACEYGGNITKSVPHRITHCQGHLIYGADNLAAEIPKTASELLSNNLFNFISYIYSQATDTLHHNLDDSLLMSTLLQKE